MVGARQHVEEIRRVKFSIGAKEPNPLTEDLHQAVKNLSAELYAKDVHFLMELIQNAEDNEYDEGVDPSLQFVITSTDITGTGAASTLLIFNNEKGFSPKNIDSICSVGRSTKKNNRKRGYIGEKGIGFKSVFLITRQPYIFSNGYQIRFNESPCPDCNVGYIVPEWVEDNQILSEIKLAYGSNSNLPTTTILLPLKPDKVKPVKEQLSSVHPELLLFLSKIKKLSIREDDEADPISKTFTAISISSETNFVTRKNIDAESFLLHLSADDERDRGCSYYMWRQRFRVRPENMVEKRTGVEEYVITLAFPNGERLQRGSNSPGIYAFLPTEMVTNFPFIIQADFLLGSSRESILLDCKWNLGILSCVPTAFVRAFISLVKEKENAPVSILPRMFSFLPTKNSPYAFLNSVKDLIQSRLMEENIIPCESYTQQKFFHKPQEVGRLKPSFWDLLDMARKKGVCLDNISTHGKYILSSAFDDKVNDEFLSFLKVGFVDDEWYAKCVRGSNLVLGGGEDLYLELLLFVAENWCSFSNTSLLDIPLLKYVGAHSQVSVCKINEIPLKQGVLLSRKCDQISWLIDWNTEFLGVKNLFFIPKSTQSTIFSHSKSKTIRDWLRKEVKVYVVSVNDYALCLSKVLGSDRNRVVAYAHFLHHSFGKNYLSAMEVNDLARSMPLVNNYGQVTEQKEGVVVPANGSRWLQLVGSNPWRDEGYIELGEDYLFKGNYAGVVTRKKEMLRFLKSRVAASDLPDLPPPDTEIPSFYSLLTKENVFLLLQWIRKWQLPSTFLNCVKNGSWLKVSPGTSKPPSQSFLLTDSSCKFLVQNGSVLVDIPLVDQTFYGKEISDYKYELRKVGVMSELSEVCEYIGNHLMSIAASSTLTRTSVFSILNFIRVLREKFLPADDFVKQLRDKKWLRTSQGGRSPSDSVLYDQNWKAASLISDIPFIDHEYYGADINSFKTELKLLGVVVDFLWNYKFIVDNLKSHCKYQSAEVVLLLLECMHNLSSSSDKLVRVLKDSMHLKTTNKGYKSPAKCYLSDPSWGCLLQVFNSFSLIDTQFYGGNTILSFRDELAKIGVLVDFEEATKAFARVFRQQASSSSINKDHVLLFLACLQKLKVDEFHEDLKKCIQEAKWLRTRLTNYRSPKDVILFSPEWMPIATISLLPFIDDSENYYGKAIHDYKKELQSIGVVIHFKSGAKFVASYLRLPHDPSVITAKAACSLLECIRNLQSVADEASIDTILKKAGGAWIKTHVGYRSPVECLLFSADWASSLTPKDGPFIDENFYGQGIASFSKELNVLGVVVEKKNGCSLLASHLSTHTDFTSIKRIYSHLSEMNWKPKDEEAETKIWNPLEGIWVNSVACVLHDDGLFGEKLYVLEKYYENNLLNFFLYAFGVKTRPTLDDYCKLWLGWEDRGHVLSNEECIAVWVFVAKHWSSVTQKVLSESFRKVPVASDGSDKIMLMDKCDVFVADDLCLKDLFEKSASQPLFVWYPQPSLISLPRKNLLDIYGKIGVRNLSECVEMSKLSACDVEGGEVDSREVFINRGLFKLILSFLAGMQIGVQKRHEAVKSLLKITVIETPMPITVGYSLRLKSGEIINVDARRLVRWEKEKSEFYVHKMDKSGGRKNMFECATWFGQVISEGILWDEKEVHIKELAELVKVGFILEFDEEAIGFMMKTKNLQIFLEDEEFLSSAFSSSS